MLNLVLHCGARHVDRRAVEEAATPAASPTWVPVPHHRLLEQVEETLTGSGMSVVNQAHALWNNGLRYFGLLEVTNGQAHDDYGLVIGLRNSHDKSFPAAIALGNAVFVVRQSRVFGRGDNRSPAHAIHRARSATCRAYGGRPTCRYARAAGRADLRL